MVGRVHERLGVGEVVDGGDAPMHNAQLLLDNLGEGRAQVRVRGWGGSPCAKLRTGLVAKDWMCR